jgi:hypothetical protein
MDTIKFGTKGMCDFINVLKSLDNIRRHISSVYNGKNISRLVFISHEVVTARFARCSLRFSLKLTDVVPVEF